MIAMSLDLATILTLLIAEAGAILGAVLGFLRFVWPKIKSTERAVNYGRMERVEEDLISIKNRLDGGEDRFQKIKDDIDRNDARNDVRHKDLTERIDTFMLTMVDKG